MMRVITTLAAVAVLGGGLEAQDGATDPAAFDKAADQMQQRLETAAQELAELRTRIQAERDPMNEELRRLEAELRERRGQQDEVERKLQNRTVELSRLSKQVEVLQGNSDHLKGLLKDYLRNFEAVIHVAEMEQYEPMMHEARVAAAKADSSQAEIFATQVGVLKGSLDRMEQILGGTRFPGGAVGPDGVKKQGQFAMVGPIAVFASQDGQLVGIAEKRLNSYEPKVSPFEDPELISAAQDAIGSGQGRLPMDPTLGDALRLAESEVSWWEQVQKGGTVMIPIGVMAAAAFLVAIFKWIGLAFVGRPSQSKLEQLYGLVRERDFAGAQRLAASLKGPAGRMLLAGSDHLGEPKELVEEVMYESTLTAKLKLNRMLPFIAICAASAPLLGLLGTVTGIINTFAMIEVYGSSDIKSISGGISEALITTQYGLIVAIPSLLLHAFLSRKARGILGQMESAAINFSNEVGRVAPAGVGGSGAPDPDMVKAQVNEILQGLLGPVLDDDLGAAASRFPATVGKSDSGSGPGSVGSRS